MPLAAVRALHSHRLHDAPVLEDAHVALQNLRHSGHALAALLVSTLSHLTPHLRAKELTIFRYAIFDSWRRGPWAWVGVAGRWARRHAAPVWAVE